jgi:hypothetical protein
MSTVAVVSGGPLDYSLRFVPILETVPLLPLPTSREIIVLGSGATLTPSSKTPRYEKM